MLEETYCAVQNVSIIYHPIITVADPHSILQHSDYLEALCDFASQTQEIHTRVLQLCHLKLEHFVNHPNVYYHSWESATVSRIGGHPVRNCLFDHVRSTCQCSLLHFFQGTVAFERTAALFFSVQELLVPHGITCTGLVSS